MTYSLHPLDVPEESFEAIFRVGEKKTSGTSSALKNQVYLNSAQPMVSGECCRGVSTDALC